MRTIVLFLILLGCGTSHITAQNDYLVTTIPNQEDPLSEEEQFIKENFPLQLLCKWTSGMKFMFIPSGRDMFLPTLSVYETEKGADNSVLKHKILTFAGYEEKSQKLSNDMSYSTRLIFECDGEKYYYGEFYQFNLSSCIRQQNSLTAQFVSFSLSNLANIFYPPNFYNN